MERIPQDQVMQFLRGLNDQYSNVRSNILMMDSLPPIAKVFSYAVQQERQVLNSILIGNLKFEVKGSTINAASSGSAPTCSYCGRVGHIVHVCYLKHDFPFSRGGKRGRGSYGRGTKMCKYEEENVATETHSLTFFYYIICVFPIFSLYVFRPTRFYSFFVTYAYLFYFYVF